MAQNVMGRLAVVLILALDVTARAQTVGPRPPDDGEYQPAAPTQNGQDTAPDAAVSVSDGTGATVESRLFDRLWTTLSLQEDPDGAIDTDRPTFTPAHTVVPFGRVQFESGFTFDTLQTSSARATTYDFPELAMRVGVAKRVEFRTFWFGQTYAQTQPRAGGRRTQSNGPSDMEVGFKWQLIERQEQNKWIPTTALITSIFAPTGGTSPFSSETVDPYINLVYGWRPTDKVTLCGSTGYLGRREHFAPRSGRRSDSFERYHQSLAAFYSLTDRTSFFYEWYILILTQTPDQSPLNYMDGGMIYHPTANTQLDLRAGFGLNGRSDEFFTGAGFSVRF